MTIILPGLPIEIPMRALIDIDDYSNWNTSLTHVRKLLQINTNTDLVHLKIASLIPIFDREKSVRLLRYWGDGRL